MSELTRRYIVMALATEGPFDVRDHDAAFVLKPWKDPAALKALEAYRAHCYPELGLELGVWIEAVRSEPAVRGGVGARNEQHLASAVATSRRPPATRRPHRKVKTEAARRKLLRKKGKRRRD